MKDKKIILWDLDGTLTDPFMGITNSIIHALKYYNIEVSDRKSLIPFIGPPLVDSFSGIYGFSPKKAREAVDKYREYFSVKGKFENEVYAGIPELLQSLKSMGKTLIVATAKPTVFSKDILKHFDLYKYFDFISGPELDETRNSKLEVMQYAIEQCEINVDDAVMIGDRKYDVESACTLNMNSIGVLFGYGSKEELINAGATVLAESVDELKSILI